MRKPERTLRSYANARGFTNKELRRVIFRWPSLALYVAIFAAGFLVSSFVIKDDQLRITLTSFYLAGVCFLIFYHFPKLAKREHQKARS